MELWVNPQDQLWDDFCVFLLGIRAEDQRSTGVFMRSISSLSAAFLAFLAICRSLCWCGSLCWCMVDSSISQLLWQCLVSQRQSVPLQAVVCKRWGHPHVCSRGVYCDNKEAMIGRSDLYQIKLLAPIVNSSDFEICCFYFRPEESSVPKICTDFWLLHLVW